MANRKSSDESGRKKVAAEGEPIEQLGRDNRTDGPSPLTDVDRMALGDAKSQWQERSAPAAGDPLTAAELDGLTLLGGSSIRDGAIGGVSDPIRDGSGGPRERPDDEGITPGGAGTQRRNPPLVADAATEDGGLSMSGGRAGGARGHGGASDRANPARESDAGPGESRGSSRMDLDHPSATPDA